MVVISAGICNKNGKILVARNFIPITRLKLEEYMANFPKLIESGKYISQTLIDAWIDTLIMVIRKIVHSHRDWEYQVCVSAHGEVVLGVDYQ